MATPKQEVTKEVDLRRNYVAASALGLQRGARRLPQVSNEVDGHPQPNCYDMMACDPEVAAALLLLVYFILADGIQSSPAVGEKDPRYKLAVDINQHIERTVANLQRPLKETLEMIVKDALTHGSKVAEKIYDIPTTGLDAYKLVLSQIKVKPKGATAFVVDEFFNLIGVVPTNRGITPQINENSNVIPPEKFVIATYRMKDEDPRGNSLFRPAVKAWNLKQLGWPEFLTYAMRCAVPGLIGVLSERAKDRVSVDSNGVQTAVSAIDEMLQSLVEFKNSTAMAVDFGANVKTLEVAGEGEFWERFFKIVNKEITKGILLQELGTSDSDHQTKSSTETQFGVIDVLVRAGKVWVEQIVYSQIFYPQIAYNYGEEIARELTPFASCGDSERRNWFIDAEAISKLINTNVLSDSQVQALLLQVGIAPREENERPVETNSSLSNQNQQQNNQQQNQGATE
jgi:hypothetical protein